MINLNQSLISLFNSLINNLRQIHTADANAKKWLSFVASAVWTGHTSKLIWPAINKGNPEMTCYDDSINNVVLGIGIIKTYLMTSASKSVQSSSASTTERRRQRCLDLHHTNTHLINITPLQGETKTYLKVWTASVPPCTKPLWIKEVSNITITKESIQWTSSHIRFK